MLTQETLNLKRGETEKSNEIQKNTKRKRFQREILTQETLNLKREERQK